MTNNAGLWLIEKESWPPEAVKLNLASLLVNLAAASKLALVRDPSQRSGFEGSAIK